MSIYHAKRHDERIVDAKANAIVIKNALENRRAENGFYGEDGEYDYKAEGTHPTRSF